MRHTVKDAIGAIQALRQVADHIEQNGPNVMIGGVLTVDIEHEAIDIHDWAGNVAARRNGPMSITLNTDLVMRGALPYAPSCGLRKVSGEGGAYQWDGEPPRAPKKGEHYLANDPVTWVSRRATRNLKKPRHIMQKCS